MSFNVCCVPGCTVNRNRGILHRFPHPDSEKPRFDQWVSSIGGPVAELDDNYIVKTRRVCRKHFEPVFQYPKNRLCRLAVPTLFMPDGQHKGSEIAPISTNEESAQSNVNLVEKKIDEVSTTLDNRSPVPSTAGETSYDMTNYPITGHAVK